MSTRTDSQGAPSSVVATSAVKNALGETLRGSNASAGVKLVAGMTGGLAEACLLQPLGASPRQTPHTAHGAPR